MTAASIEFDEVAGHRFELEVHPSGARLHVAARHLGTVIAPDDAAQRMQRRVGPHQREPAGPVEVDVDRVTDLRRLLVAGLEFVDDLALGLPGGADGPAAAIGGPQDQAAIGRLAATSGVEHRPIEHDQRCVADLHVSHGGTDRPRIGIGVADLLTGGRHSAVSVPVMFGWTVHTNV